MDNAIQPEWSPSIPKVAERIDGCRAFFAEIGNSALRNVATAVSIFDQNLSHSLSDAQRGVERPARLFAQVRSNAGLGVRLE